jgi:hypothetical protein
MTKENWLILIWIISGYPDEDKPVFFGHYWFTGTPERIKENVAYHWNNKDQNINNESFVRIYIARFVFIH